MNRRIRGDGTTGNPGLSHQSLKDALRSPLSRFITLLRYDALYRSPDLDMFRAVENQVTANLPSWTDANGFARGWKFVSAGSQQYHALDACLLRMNGFSGPGNSLPPAVAPPVATAITAPQGSLSSIDVSNAPAAVYSLVGAEDWQESLPSPAITLTPLTGAQNAWSLGGSAWNALTTANLPATVTKLRFYRTATGGAASGQYGFDQDVSLTPGQSLPNVLMTQSDGQVRFDIAPPAWGQSLMTPEAAALFACAFGAAPLPTGEQPAPIQYQASGMISPANVVLIPSNAMLGIANPPSSGRFGQAVVTSATVVTYTQGGIATQNAAGASLQGFAGAAGVQARVTQALGGAGALSLDYVYYDAAHGWGVTQEATSAPATFAGTAVGSLLTWTIPAGRIVTGVMGLPTPSGFGTFGTFDVEGTFPRSY
jgi:hypothetical protein